MPNAAVGAITGVLCGGMRGPPRSSPPVDATASAYSLSPRSIGVTTPHSAQRSMMSSGVEMVDVGPVFNSQEHMRRTATVLLAPAPTRRRELRDVIAASHVHCAERPKTVRVSETRGEPQTPAGADATVSRTPSDHRMPGRARIPRGEELVPLLRLGSLQGRASAELRGDRLPTDLNLAGMDFTWVYDPTRRPRRRSGWVSLASGPTGEWTGCLNSPRSLLTVLSRGIQPSDLAPVDVESLTRRLRAERLAPAAIELQVSFLQSQRDDLWKQATAAYDRWCATIARETIVEFVDAFVADGSNYARLPQMRPVPTKPEDGDAIQSDSCTRSPRLEVMMPTDDRVEEAMRGTLAKAAQEQNNLRVRASMELEARRRLANLGKERAVLAIAAHERRQTRSEQKRLHKEQEAALQVLITEARNADRDASKAEQLRAIEAERMEREQRSKALEATMSEAKAARMKARLERVGVKRAQRQSRVEAAIATAERIEAQRQQRIAENEEYAAALLKQKQEEQVLRRQQVQQKTALNVARRSEVAERAAIMLEESRQEAEQRQAEVEATLAAFAHRKEIEAKVQQLRDLKKALIREDLMAAAAAKDAIEERARALAAEAQNKRFETYRQSVQDERLLSQERAREANELKRALVERNERAAEFRRYTTESLVATKMLTASLVGEARHAIVEKASGVRAQLRNERVTRMELAHEEKVASERASYFATYSVVNGGAKRTRTPGNLHSAREEAQALRPSTSCGPAALHQPVRVSEASPAPAPRAVTPLPGPVETM